VSPKSVGIRLVAKSYGESAVNGVWDTERKMVRGWDEELLDDVLHERLSWTAPPSLPVEPDRQA
jgi:hypothetical protein